MSDIIHLLSDAVANQIAAGEVIQRPASVLKELAENAIDAGATQIHMVIQDAGRTLVQVTDNGKGMSASDARMAFERHATSKIAHADDLFSIRTMGFRGEALASIAAVAQVELRTRRANDELGTWIEIAGSRLFRNESTLCAVGTTFMVKNLFFNVPARRRFLKSDSVEKNHLLNEFYRLVLVNKDIEFSLKDGDEEIFHLPPVNTKVRIEQVFGSAKRKINPQLLSIESRSSLVHIAGYVSRPEFAQKNAHQFFFVNGRYMRHPYFQKAVTLAYSQLIQPTEQPAFFIYFDIDPAAIDINIHPTKTEIKFENEQAIWSILSAAVKEALGKFHVMPSLDFDREGAPDMPILVPGTPVMPPQVRINPSYNPFSTPDAYRKNPVDWEKLYRDFESTPEPVQSQLPFQSENHSTTHDETEPFGHFFQLKNKYLITSVKSGMLVVDQRKAHVRVMYDQFMKEIGSQKGFSQQLLFPETLHLLPDEVLFFEKIKHELAFTGFVWEPLQQGEYLIKGVPVHLQRTVDVMALLQQVVQQAQHLETDSVEAIHEHIALQLAEASAIRSGQKLTHEEISDLINRLFACHTHQHTPDGKIIMTIITEDELASRLK